MEIKCTKCGHPNQLGAIFCRGCGEKLELENLKPEVKASGRAKIGISGYAIKRLISLLITITLIIVVICLFLPTSYYNPTEDTDEKRVKDLYTVLYQRLNGRVNYKKYPSITLSADEIGAIITKDFLDGYAQADPVIDVETSERNFLLKKIDFVKTGDNSFDLHATIRFNLGFTKDLTNSLSFSFENTDEGTKFTLTGARYGKVPVPGFGRNPIINNFKSAVDAGDDLNVMLGNIQKLELDDGDYVVTFKPFASEAKEKKK